MAGHNSETALKLLKDWKTILNKEAEALSNGRIGDIEQLFQKTLELQQQLTPLLSLSGAHGKDKTLSRMIREVYNQQEKLINSMRIQAEELAQEIGLLVKNQASLKGYKQSNKTQPRFMNKHT